MKDKMFDEVKWKTKQKKRIEAEKNKKQKKCSKKFLYEFCEDPDMMEIICDER